MKAMLLNIKQKLERNQALNKKQKSEFSSNYCIKIQEIVEQINRFDINVDLKYIKNIMFEENFENKLIFKYQFPLNLNITTNLIHMYNLFLVFGTQEGIIHVFDIQKTKIIITQKISQFGLVVLVKDPRRSDYFFISGYDGNIIEFQLQITLPENRNFKSIESINQNIVQINNQFSSQVSRNLRGVNNQYFNEEQMLIENQINQFGNKNSKTQSSNQDLFYSQIDVNLKRKRTFSNRKQICRLITFQNGKFLVAGVGKKIVVWNIITGKIFQRLKGYHSSQVYGLETILYDKYILSISKGTINMFDITRVDNPLVIQKRIAGNQLFTRVKKISEYEFLVMIFPKKIAFFKIFEDEQFSQNTTKTSSFQSLDEIQKQNIQNHQDSYDNLQQLIFDDMKSFKEYSQQSQKQVKKNKNISIVTLKKQEIIKTGEIKFTPDLAYNINVFDNYFFNISGDYEYSMLINLVNLKSSTTSIDLEKSDSNLKFESNLRFLSYNNERVLTSTVLENVTIQNKFYKNVLINMPRNSHYEGEENFPQSLNMCFFA
ncbi:hypothetical protein TTHERM_00015950 (macronuclear) [Tetrahymena thermophila SB210]|uniref:WD domain, G-beta repeat protein n=1 Tax=Tetrahymena thermophila (strain SB210) TaxID=312017 RepID=Q22RJ2_TETTS|nr:hypothetical protein TTHERM_00015950 [Tetrahymena thermophila SB210]EAR88130.2 hypothetical protein TTHERM_00015950 [Tetrahymena thermophila SB210]|eukprot:XP_001008375.2 hypothetical protein TTHERM_00015950 [Tetrahymena thermophila SB210]